MRVTTVTANREPQPFLLRETPRPSPVASTGTAEEKATNVCCRRRQEESVRTLTVSILLRQRSSGRNGHDRVPFLRLSGRWLEQCGFAIGARYYVTVAKGKLILTLAKPDGSDEPTAE